MHLVEAQTREIQLLFAPPFILFKHLKCLCTMLYQWIETTETKKSKELDNPMIEKMSEDIDTRCLNLIKKIENSKTQEEKLSFLQELQVVMIERENLNIHKKLTVTEE